MKKRWVIAFLCLLWMLMTVQGALAQSTTPTQTPSPTPDPTLVALEATVGVQQKQIADLEDKLVDEKRDREYMDRDLVWKWGIAATVGGIFLILAAGFGISNVQDAKKKVETARKEWEKNVRDQEKEWERRAELMLDKAIFRFDPSNLPVQLPTDLTKIHQMLTHRALGKIEFYDDLRDLTGDKLKGVIVISMVDKGKLEENQQKLLDFVSQQKLDPAMTGIILYTGSNRVDEKVSTVFENLVTANYPATVVSNILVVGRGIKIEPPAHDREK